MKFLKSLFGIGSGQIPESDRDLVDVFTIPLVALVYRDKGGKLWRTRIVDEHGRILFNMAGPGTSKKKACDLARVMGDAVIEVDVRE